MKRVLLVEDNGSLSDDLKEKIDRNLGYFAEIAYSFTAAHGVWKEDRGNFDCIVLDLQIKPTGLDPDEVQDYYPVFGIAFLDKICEGKKSEERAGIYKKIIIYSGFTRELDDWKKRKPDNQHLRNIVVMSKEKFGISNLMDKIKNVCER